MTMAELEGDFSALDSTPAEFEAGTGEGSMNVLADGIVFVEGSTDLEIFVVTAVELEC